MIFGDLKRALRFSLGAICLVMALSLGVQAYSLKSTARETSEAMQLGAEIAPSMDSVVPGADLSGYQDLVRSSLFYAEQKREMKPPQLEGLVGGYALMDGRMWSEGDTVQGWKVAQIGANDVLVTRDDENGQAVEQRLTLYPDSTSLVIDNRPKQEQRDQPPRQFAGPEGSDSSRLSEWRDRLERMRREGSSSAASPAYSSMPRVGSGTLSALRGMSPSEIEQAIRERYGGDLPSGMDGEKIKAMVDRMSQSTNGSGASSARPSYTPSSTPRPESKAERKLSSNPKYTSKKKSKSGRKPISRSR